MSKKYFKELYLLNDYELNVELENISCAEFRKAIDMALKEQDRDTRHACAEAVNRIAGDDKTITYAYGVIMNTTAV